MKDAKDLLKPILIGAVSITIGMILLEMFKKTDAYTKLTSSAESNNFERNRGMA